MKKVLCALLVLSLFSASFIAFATTNSSTWTCPNCEKNCSTNFCPDCGSKRPETSPAPSANSSPKAYRLPPELFQTESLFSTGSKLIQKDVEPVKQGLLKAGFLFSDTDTDLFADYQLYQFKSDDYDFILTLFADRKTNLIKQIEFAFLASESNYSAIFRSLYRTYGVPSTYPLTSDRSETRFWPVSKGITYQLSGDIISGAYKTDHCFLTSVQKGTRSFSLFVTSDSKVRLIATPTPKPTAKPTRRPTAKPTVAPKIGNAITIASVSLGSDSIGNPALYVVFKNNSGATVDRIDFTVECYDVYGRLIKGYGYYDESNCFYDGRISQGRKSDSSQRWMFYGFDGIKSVRIAITDYHTLNGKSVHVPRSSWDYTKYTFR